MLNRLLSTGWDSYIFDGANLVGHLMDVALRLGTPTASRRKRSPLEVLTPIERKEARPSSSSRLFGIESIPLHTDTAHWVTPCRYIILGCVSPGTCGRRTILADSAQLGLHNEARQLLRDCQFRVVNGRRSFFAPVMHSDISLIRFDQACMAPIDAESRLAFRTMRRAVTEVTVDAVDWSAGRVLVVDNWRMLHGRTEPTRAGGGRVLARVLVQ